MRNITAGDGEREFKIYFGQYGMDPYVIGISRLVIDRK